ncbi:MAG: hypothetical protein ABA06_03535 [Parcubacteria bacterium C7867-001]|nr:MAG: hypothetical protein ABA06_03535 [Parcubacteria bacterium C7867-001]
MKKRRPKGGASLLLYVVFRKQVPTSCCGVGLGEIRLLVRAFDELIEKGLRGLFLQSVGDEEIIPEVVSAQYHPPLGVHAGSVGSVGYFLARVILEMIVLELLKLAQTLLDRKFRKRIEMRCSLRIRLLFLARAAGCGVRAGAVHHLLLFVAGVALDGT